MANMARNGSFSRGLVGWTSSGAEVSSNQGRNGTKCARFPFSGTTYGYVYQTVPIEAQSIYTVSCWVKWKECSRLIIARSHNGQWEYTTFPFDTPTSNEYREFSITYDLSDGLPVATGLSLTFYVYRNSSAEAAEAFIDGIEVNGPAPTRLGVFSVHGSCPVYSKATGNHLDTNPAGRRLYAYYEDGDTITLHWPSKGKPLAFITLDDTLITGTIDPNFTWSNAARLLQVVSNEVGRTLDDFGNVADPWCQTFVNWVAVLGAVDIQPVYDISGCSSAINELGDRFHPVGDTYQPDDYYPLCGDWIYYKNIDLPEDPDKPADHVGFVVGTSTGGNINTIEANRGGDTVQRYLVPGRGVAAGSNLKVIGFAKPPYNS